MSVTEGDDGRALIHCHAGCDPESIAAALGLDMADLFADKQRGPGPTITANGHHANERSPTRPERPTPLGPVLVEYLYRDTAGTVVYRVTRHEPKMFRPWRPDGRGGWKLGLGSVAPLLYRLPELVAADAAAPVFVVEGEKDADALASLGIVATTNSGGAQGTWPEAHTAALAGRDVVILPDNDDAGRAHAERVAGAVVETARSVKVLALAGLPAKGDVSDWLAAGGTADELRRLARVAPAWEPAATTPAGADGSRLLLVPMSSVAAKPIDWLWERWLARGKVHLLGGHAGDGKSTLTAWLAALLSTGGILPDGQRVRPGRSLFLLAEDDLADTVRPRLDLHGADASKVLAIRAVKDGDGKEKVFNLARHLEDARAAIIAHAIDLWVIDPLSAFMPKADRNAEGDVRDLLTPVLRLAEDTGVAVLGVVHVGKPSGTNRRPLQQLLGATAFGAVARLVWMVADTGGNDTPPRRVLGVVKSNVGPKPAPLEWSRAIDGPVMWHGESSYDLAALLTGEKENKLDAAKAFLRTELAGGSISSDGLKQAARGQGISWTTLRRAQEALGIKPYKQPGSDHGPWLWKLPDGTPRQSEAVELEAAQTHVQGHEQLPIAHRAQTEEKGIFPDSSEDAHGADVEHLPRIEDAQTYGSSHEHLPSVDREPAGEWGEGEL